jgi:hypothetical protein
VTPVRHARRLWLAVLAAAVVVAPSTALAGPAVAGAEADAGGGGAEAQVTLFPTDQLTVRDPSQLTGRRVALPMPDCAVAPTDCQDIALINQLDGFDLDPQVSLRFRGPVDPAAVAAGVQISAVSGRGAGGQHSDRPQIGLNRIVYDAATSTVYGHPTQQLAPHTTYRLTVRPTDPGHPLSAATTFTTESAPTGLLQMRRQLDDGSAYAAAGIPPQDRGLNFDGVFPADQVTGLSYTADKGSVGGTGTAPVPNTSVTNAGYYAFGSLRTPSWLTQDVATPQTSTSGRGPVVQGANRVGFAMIVPAGPAPAGGWPVAVFGHGFTRSKMDLFLSADINAKAGIATVAIDVVGHGYGPGSTINVSTLDGTTARLPAHARGFDQDANGAIGDTEGAFTPSQPSRLASISSRDGLRQTVADIMSLVRATRSGVEVPGAGGAHLSTAPVSYYGQSFGGIYGLMLGGTDPQVPVVAPNVAGGPVVEVARLSVSFRPLVANDLGHRQPSLLNGGYDGFTESLPLYGDPPVTRPAAGAIAIQQVLARETWIQRSGSPETFAPLLRLSPPRGSEPKQVLMQNAYGDQTVPNPTTATVLRAGHLQDVESLYRNDKTPNAGTNPHGFLLDPTFGLGNLPGQQEIVTFLVSGGRTRIDPDGPLPVWEVPVTDLAVLERLNFSSPP